MISASPAGWQRCDTGATLPTSYMSNRPQARYVRILKQPPRESLRVTVSERLSSLLDSVRHDVETMPASSDRLEKHA
jgi:hypothetical protein